MSKDNFAIKPEGDIDKAKGMGNPDGVFNQPFQPMAGLPTREVADQVEKARIAINAKDTIRLEPHTLRSFAAAQWVTKIEFQAVMSHIRIIEAEKQEAQSELRVLKNRYAEVKRQWEWAEKLIRQVEGSRVGAFTFFVHKLLYGRSHILSSPISTETDLPKSTK